MAVSKRLRFEVFRRDSHTCKYCGRSAPEVKLTIDHVVPEALGGRDEPSNLVTACSDCNNGKSSVPADAAIVEDVQEDALRWSRAIAVAAERMLADREARNAVYDEFDEKWQTWTVRGQPLPRPNDWRQSIERFIASGLPMAVLWDCVDIAMANQKVPPKNLFRYMCGIAWKRVAELQQAARAAVGALDSQEEPYDIESLAKEVLGMLFDGEIDDIVRKARERKADGDEDSYSGCSEEVAAARMAIEEVTDERHAMFSAVDRLYRHLPDGMSEEICDEIAQYVAEPSIADLTVGALRHLAVVFANDYLATLPEAERDEWIASARNFHQSEEGNRVTLTAAEHAKRWKRGELVLLSGLCAGPGDHGACCPKWAEFRFWLDQCSRCEGACGGHSGMCERHLDEALRGAFRQADGEPFQIANFEPIDTSGQWGDF